MLDCRQDRHDRGERRRHGAAACSRLHCAAVIVAAGVNAAAFAQCQLVDFQVQPSSGGEAVGWSVTANSQFAIIGAYYGTGTEFGTGSAIVCKRMGVTWQPFTTLFAPDGVFGDYFGSAAAIDGDHLLISSFRHPHESGEGDVYSYKFDGNVWNYQGKLAPPPDVQVDQFGYAIAAQNGVAIISAYRNDHGILSGSAFIYRCVEGEWMFEQRLIPTDDPEALIGWSVAIDGNRVIAGSLSTSLAEFEKGAAYVFETATLSKWKHVATLVPFEMEQGLGFGGAVGLRNGWAAVGSYKDSIPGHQSGSVYMYRLDAEGAWKHHKRLVANDSQSHDYFGSALAMNDDTLIVGAIGRKNASGNPAGGAYMFSRTGDTWTQSISLSPSSLGAGDNFGFSVALSGDVCLVGAPGHDIPLVDTGAAYAFSIHTCDCNGNAVSDACEIASGQLTDANTDGVPDGCQTLGCPGDCALPSNGLVDGTDLLAIVENWNREFPLCEVSQTGVNGVVDLDDLMAVLDAWGPCR
jgi:hypothetical protein